jgi:hypothetical protein
VVAPWCGNSRSDTTTIAKYRWTNIALILHAVLPYCTPIFPSLPLDCFELWQCVDRAAQIFLRTTKNRVLDPSEIRALEFKGEVSRFAGLARFQRLSASIG